MHLLILAIKILKFTYMVSFFRLFGFKIIFFEFDLCTKLFCRFAEIQEKLTPFLKHCGFKSKSPITYIPCSGLQGTFLKDRPSTNICSWYK